MSKLISKLFPNESRERWFQINAKTYTGKLFSTYRTYRSKYMQMGPFEPFKLKGMFFTQFDQSPVEELETLEEPDELGSCEPMKAIIYDMVENVTVRSLIPAITEEYSTVDVDPIGIKTEAEVPQDSFPSEYLVRQNYEPQTQIFHSNVELPIRFEPGAYSFATIKYINLNNREDLFTIVNNENRGVMLKYQKDGTLDNSYRDSLSNLLIFNLIKRNFKQKYVFLIVYFSHFGM